MENETTPTLIFSKVDAVYATTRACIIFKVMKFAFLAFVGLLVCLGLIQAQEPVALKLSDFPLIEDLPNCLGRDRVVGKYFNNLQ